MPETVDRAHVWNVARWALPDFVPLAAAPLIGGGVRIRIVGPHAFRRARTALATAGYVVEGRGFLDVVAWNPPTVTALYEIGVTVVATCPLCENWFTITAFAAGGISDCPKCPWRGVVGSAMAMPGTPGGGPRR